MSYHFLPFKLEDAVKAYLLGEDAAIGTSANVYLTAEAVADGAEVAEPFVAINAPNDAPAIPEAGQETGVANRIVTVNLMIQSHAETGVRDSHAALVGRVMDTLHRTDMATALQAYADASLGIDMVDVPQAIDTAPIDRGYRTTVSFQVICHPVSA